MKFGFYNFEKAQPEISVKLEECTKRVVQLLGITGFGRVDYRIDYNNNIYVTDIATNPHITKVCHFTMLFLKMV